MNQAATMDTEIPVLNDSGEQIVRIPASFRFSGDRVYIRRDPDSGTVSLSETPMRRSLAQVFRELDEMGSSEYELEREQLPAVDRELP